MADSDSRQSPELPFLPPFFYRLRLFIGKANYDRLFVPFSKKDYSRLSYYPTLGKKVLDHHKSDLIFVANIHNKREVISLLRFLNTHSHLSGILVLPHWRSFSFDTFLTERFELLYTLPASSNYIRSVSNIPFRIGVYSISLKL